jgi:methyl-accepting chemotaxis protein
MKPHKRRIYLIKKDFQARLFVGYLLFCVGGGLFFILLIGLFSPESLINSYINHDLQFGRTPIGLMIETTAAPWLFVILSGAIFILAAMFITHRIAGPLFRFEKTLDNMLEGNLDDAIHLRSKDEGKELAEKINTFNADLSAKLKHLQAHSEAIAELLDQCRTRSQRLSPNEEEELNCLFWGLCEKNKKIKAICTSYTLADE